MRSGWRGGSRRWVRASGNRGLFWAACRLAEAGLPPADTLDALAPAAERAGLPLREVVVTIRSAYRTISTALARQPEHGVGHGETPRRSARVERQVLS